MTITSRLIVAGDIAGTFFDHPGYISGNWYAPLPIGAFATGSAGTANQLTLFPAYIRNSVTLQALGGRVNTIGAAGNVQFAVYAHNAVTGRPTGAALASTASASTGTAASVNGTVSVTLTPGLYWFAVCVDNATAVLEAINNETAAYLIGSATQGNDMTLNAGISGVRVTGTFGTWPDLTSATFGEVIGGIPAVQFRVA